VTVRLVRSWPPLDHLQALSDCTGVFEHALYAEPRREHGYCVDDVARALVVVCREKNPTAELARMAELYLAFVAAAVQPDGTCHNRRNAQGEWTDEPSVGDWWGRAIWGLGVASVHAPTSAQRARALEAFRRAAQAHSPHLRATVFAGLGAGEVLLAVPAEGSARRLLLDVVAAVGPPLPGPGWVWPEPRLTYGNGSVAEALLLAGVVLPDAEVTEHALQLLGFLLRTESRAGRLSVTPAGGRDAAHVGVGFDQQPIEVAAIAEACARAYAVTGDLLWRNGVLSAWAWFDGVNDSGTVMYDCRTGGGFDGLERHGANQNQGAESTLAMLATAQLARAMDVL
jgi:hypothetical protein